MRWQLMEYIRRWDCYRQAWETVRRGEGEPLGIPVSLEMTASEPDVLVLPANFAEWNAG
jgi:hypothetical protein